MAKRRKTAVEKYHDRVAARYDHSYDDAYWNWHDAITWDHIKRYLPPNLRAPVLDLGCGTGKWAAKLAKSGYAVTCVDISLAMLDRADAKLREERPGPSPALTEPRPSGSSPGAASLVQADLCDLSALPRHGFALALAMGDPIGCTESPAKALKEILHVLSPGGVLIATFDNRLSALDYYLHQADPRTMEEFLRTGQTRWLTRDHEERFPIHTYTPTQVRKLLTSAGYKVLDLIGKTVLPMRHHRALLADPRSRRRWMKIEKSLHRDEAAVGRASHVQIAARRPASQR